MPHGHCYHWQSHLLWTNVFSDICIALAYFSIPVAILFFLKKRPDVYQRKIFVLFSLFILCCGITHLLGTYTIWHGTYGILAIAKAVTAIVSCITAVIVFKSIPEAIKLPTTAQYNTAKEQLSDEQVKRQFFENAFQDHSLFRFISDAMPTGAVIINSKNKFRFANHSFLFSFEYDQDSLFGKHLSTIIAMESSEIIEEVNRVAQRTHEQGIDQAPTIITQGITASGLLIPIEISVIRDDFNNEQLTLLSIHDLSEKIAAEKTIIDTHLRLERSASATNDGTWEWNVKTDEVWFSNRFMQMIGQAQYTSQPKYKHWIEHIHPDYQLDVKKALDSHFIDNERFEIEYLGIGDNGEYGWFLNRGDSIRDDKNGPIIMSGALSNITNSKNIKIKLAEKSQFLQTIFEGTNHATFVLKAKKNKLLYSAFNQAAQLTSGINAEYILNKTIVDMAPQYLPLDVAKNIYARYQKCADTKQPYSYIEMIPFNGVDKWYKTNLHPLLNEEGNVNFIVGAASEITELKETERKLSENEAFLSNVIENAICGLYIFEVDDSHNIKINKRYTELTGYTAKDLANIKDFMLLFHPDDRERISQYVIEILEKNDNQIRAIQYRFKHKHGHWIWCYSFDSILRTSTNQTKVQILGTFIDITDLKENAVRLEDSNKALERFAYAASHDLQEPLRKISAFSDSITESLSKLSLTEETEYELDRLNKAVHRMRDLITDLLQLSRIRKGEIEENHTTLSHIINQTQEDLSFLIEEKAIVIEQKNDCSLYVDERLFSQLFQNLFQNSLRYKHPERTPEIVITVEQIIKFETAFLQITIKDNGLGFNDEYNEMIFEPFKRLIARDKTKGSGLGLAICKQIAIVHQGNIYAHGVPDVSATFIIELPLTKK